ncbi:hypothetical protein B0H98_10542 [Vreelandella songnenensis]|uniref:Uncharacterized protein n=1 Tax=Vreelandella songnenensis TaxID=1176243 RepID=A0A2T0V2H6_9GAMM|nr:hypothetical protein [Halomonas songnenensis]PRY64383.1 hypothetical protein B0H98_10542 [Halomonas songnenensis]
MVSRTASYNLNVELVQQAQRFAVYFLLTCHRPAKIFGMLQDLIAFGQPFILSLGLTEFF